MRCGRPLPKDKTPAHRAEQIVRWWTANYKVVNLISLGQLRTRICAEIKNAVSVATDSVDAEFRGHNKTEVPDGVGELRSKGLL